MTEMSAAEAAVAARFEAGVPAPESWDDGLRSAIAQALADSDASAHGTRTWDECNGELGDDYRRYADAVLALPKVAALRAKATAADRVRDLLDHMARNRAYDLGTVQVVQRALDGATRTDRGRC